MRQNCRADAVITSRLNAARAVHPSVLQFRPSTYQSVPRWKLPTRRSSAVAEKPRDTPYQWRSKALSDPAGSTITWGPYPFLPFSLPSISLPSLPLPSLPYLPSPLLPFPPFPLTLPRPLRSRPPLIQLRERCKLPQRQRGVGRSLSRNWIWCILALKSNIGGNKFTDICENQLTKFCTIPTYYSAYNYGINTYKTVHWWNSYTEST